MTFFNVLSEEFQPGFFVRDTSSRGLKNPMAKPDIILLAENEVSRLLLLPDFVSAYFCVPFSQPLWSCLAFVFELKHSIQPKDQCESALGQTSDRAQIIIKQQPWRKRVVAFVMGRETVEAISYPGASGGDILRTGALKLFSSLGSAGIASGMRLLFRVFLSSLDQLGNSAPTTPGDISAERLVASFVTSNVCAGLYPQQILTHTALLLQCLGQCLIGLMVIQSRSLSSSMKVLNRR